MRVRHRSAVAAALFALALAACTASNPDRAQSARRQPAVQETGSRAAQDAATPAAADGAAPAAPAPGPAQAAAPAGPPLVARVDDRAIDVAAMLEAWMQVNAREVSDVIERLVAAEMVEIEAARMGLQLDPAMVEEGYRLTVADLERELALSNPGVTLDQWVTGALGLDPDRYRDGLRRDVVRRLLAERVVRAFVMSNERRNVRVVVTGSRPEIEDALAAVRAGRDFGEVVSERSIDPSKESGGRIPPVLRSQSALSRLVFLTEPGSVGGPIQDSDQGRWMIVFVDEELPALAGTWSEVGAAVEAALIGEPIQDPEYWQWKAEMSRRHEVDLEPLFELVERRGS